MAQRRPRGPRGPHQASRRRLQHRPTLRTRDTRSHCSRRRSPPGSGPPDPPGGGEGGGSPS
eukprot:8125531-Alexandrium_andersonii.AAC.1